MSEIAITQSANPAGQNVPHPTRENLLDKPDSPPPDQFAGTLIDQLVRTVEKAEGEHNHAHTR